MSITSDSFSLAGLNAQQRALLQRLDKDNDGSISKKELQALDTDGVDGLSEAELNALDTTGNPETNTTLTEFKTALSTGDYNTQFNALFGGTTPYINYTSQKSGNDTIKTMTNGTQTTETTYNKSGIATSETITDTAHPENNQTITRTVGKSGNGKNKITKEVVTTGTAPNQTTVTYNYSYNKDGSYTKKSTVAGVTTTESYDKTGKLTGTTEKTTTDGVTTTTYKDASGNPTKVVKASTTAASGDTPKTTTTTVYDATGTTKTKETIKEYAADGTTVDKTTVNEYAANGTDINKSTVTQPSANDKYLERVITDNTNNTITTQKLSKDGKTVVSSEVQAADNSKVKSFKSTTAQQATSADGNTVTWTSLDGSSASVDKANNNRFTSIQIGSGDDAVSITDMTYNPTSGKLTSLKINGTEYNSTDYSITGPNAKGNIVIKTKTSPKKNVLTISAQTNGTTNITKYDENGNRQKLLKLNSNGKPRYVNTYETYIKADTTTGTRITSQSWCDTTNSNPAKASTKTSNDLAVETFSYTNGKTSTVTRGTTTVAAHTYDAEHPGRRSSSVTYKNGVASGYQEYTYEDVALTGDTGETKSGTKKTITKYTYGTQENPQGTKTGSTEVVRNKASRTKLSVTRKNASDTTTSTTTYTYKEGTNPASTRLTKLDLASTSTTTPGSNTTIINNYEDGSKVSSESLVVLAD